MSKINSKHGEWTFKYFFAKFFNKLRLNIILFFISNFIDFKRTISKIIDFFITDFLKIFSKFNTGDTYHISITKI